MIYDMIIYERRSRTGANPQNGGNLKKTEKPKISVHFYCPSVARSALHLCGFHQIVALCTFYQKI